MKESAFDASSTRLLCGALYMEKIVVLLALAAGSAFAAAPSGSWPEAADSDKTGTVSGRVLVRGSLAGPPASLSPYARRRYRPPTTPGVAGGAEDAVVYLIGGSAAETDRRSAPTR